MKMGERRPDNAAVGVDMKLKCKNCKWWVGGKDQIPGGDGHKSCEHPKVGGGSYVNKSRLRSDALNSYESIGTGPNFGCIHFEKA